MQRRHHRYPYDAPVILRHLEPDKAGRIRNISEGGLMVELPELFPPRTPLALFIRLGEKSVRTEAEVVWSQEFPDPAGTSYRHGLKITQLELQDRLILELFTAKELGG